MTTKHFPYFGTISHATLKSDDLIGSFLPVLADLDTQGKFAYTRNRASILSDVYPLISESEPDLEEYMSETVEMLTDALSTFAPDGYYFGSHPGDGSDLGFWQNEDSEEDSE